jgi:uncharacterized protein RhaS with RHS repeats
LYYYKARFYSPNLGRFLQVDPVGYGDGLNLYAYVGDDPVNNTDPNGEFANIVLGAGIGGIASLAGAYNSNQNITFTEGLRAFGAGAIVGGLTAAVPIGGSLAASVIRNAGAGSIGNAVGQLIGGAENINGEQAAIQGLIGGVAGGAGNAVGFLQSTNYVRAGLTATESVAFGGEGGTSAGIIASTIINSQTPTSLGGYALSNSKK